MKCNSTKKENIGLTSFFKCNLYFHTPWVFFCYPWIHQINFLNSFHKMLKQWACWKLFWKFSNFEWTFCSKKCLQIKNIFETKDSKQDLETFKNNFFSTFLLSFYGKSSKNHSLDSLYTYRKIIIYMVILTEVGGPPQPNSIHQN